MAPGRPLPVTARSAGNQIAVTHGEHEGLDPTEPPKTNLSGSVVFRTHWLKGLGYFP